MDTSFNPMVADYAYAVGAVVVSTAVCFAMFRFFSPTNLVMVYLVGTLGVAARGRRGPAVLASLLGVLSFDFFFVPPRWTLTVTDAQYIWTLAVMLGVAIVISHLTVRLRTEAEAAREGERRTAMMHALTQRLASSRGTRRVLKVAVQEVGDVFGAKVTAYTPDLGGRLEPVSFADDSQILREKESGIAQWVFTQAQAAGLGTPSLPDEPALYVPLKSPSGVRGVLRIQPLSTGQAFSTEQKLLLDSFTFQIGLALEVDQLQESAEKAEVEAETERLRSALLSSVSHDLRTPLAAILGSASALLGKKEVLQYSPVRELVDNIESEGKRLLRLVQNLLEATRLESGVVKLQTELTPLEEVIGSALESLEKLLRERIIDIKLPDDLPLAPIDAVLIEQLLINLLENAAHYTPPNKRMTLSAKADTHWLTVSLADEGPGVEEEDLAQIFNKFFRGKSSTGSGLGLSICRAIVQAHGGRIWAENHSSGAAFHFQLPLAPHG